MPTIKKPGFIDGPVAMSKNSRNSRFQGLRFGNRMLSRFMDEITDTTIAFVASDRITDTGSRMARFGENQVIEVEGSDLEDGQYQTVGVVSAAILQLATFQIANDVAGPLVTLRGKTNRNRNRFQSNVN